MTAAKRLGFVAAIFLALPFLLVYQDVVMSLAEVWLSPFHGLVAAMPHLAESLGRSGWLAMECLPLLVWRSWRDVGSLRFRWSWTVPVPLFIAVMNLAGFAGWPSGHPWAGALDILWFNLLIGANEDVIFRGYMFHDRPGLHPRLTVFASSVAFALFHYVNLGHANWSGVTQQVVAAFIMGFGLGTVRLATGSLGWCILIHWLIDASAGLSGDHHRLQFLVGLILVPSWIVLTLLLFCGHPALRKVPAVAPDAPPPPASDPVRAGFGRRTVVVLLGLAAGSASLLALVLPFTSWLDGTQRMDIAFLLVGFVALPGGILAWSIARWRRWRQAQTEWILLRAGPPFDATPPDLRAVKVGSTGLFGVTLLVGLIVATLLGSAKIGFSQEPGLGFWGTVWHDRLPLGCFLLTALSPPCLALFSLRTALRPHSSRSTMVVWLFGMFFYGFLTWLALVYVHSDFRWFFVLKLSLWHLAVAGLLVALFLAVRDLCHLRRSDRSEVA